MKWIIKFKSVLLVTLGAILIIGTGIGSGLAKASAEKSSVSPVTIQSVQMRGDGASSELVIATSTPATYTSYKTSSPHRLVVDFSQAVPLDSLSDFHFNGGPVKSVTLKRFDTDAGVLTRMEVYLTQDVEPIITPSTEKHGELRISFPGFKVEAQVQKAKQDAVTPVQPELAPVQPKTEVTKDIPINLENSQPVITDVVVRNGLITIVSQAPIKDYKTFRLNKPERVVVDIFNAKATMVNKLVQLNEGVVSTARVGNYSDKVRIVFDSLGTSLPDATFENSSNGLNVVFAPTPKGAQDVATPSPAKPNPVAVNKQTAVKAAGEESVAQVTSIDFQVVDSISRVTLKLTGSPVVDEPVKAAGYLSFRIKNAQLPRNLQRSLEAREFVSPVLRVTPVQIKTKSSTDVLVRVSLKTDATYELRREADILFLDVIHPVKMTNSTEKNIAGASTKKTSVTNNMPAVDEKKLVEVTNNSSNIDSKDSKAKVYRGRRVSLEFADAEVRSIFQLLSEVSGKNFVLGDEIGGKINLKLVNVPWDQAFDIILTTKGFESQEQDNVLIVRGAGKLKSELDSAAEKRAAQLKSGRMVTRKFAINYSNSEDVAAVLKPLVRHEWQGSVTSDKRTNTVIVNAVEQLIGDMEDLVKSIDIPEKQVMIEARIIEASTDFTRSLGVSWGLATSTPASGTAGRDWPFINQVSSVFGGIASTPGASSIGSTTGAADISFGTIGANVKLSMRLNAAAKAGLIRIVSSPKVATLNNKTAKITQGKQIPYISSTSDKVETKFVEAALSLEVTPHINNNGTISLKIDAKNDSPDTTSTSSTPPINKKQATTEMLLRDGETTIIGGIFVDSDSEGQEGIPWLMDVPILGNLFKSTSYTKNKSELLIFITPRILNSLI